MKLNDIVKLLIDIPEEGLKKGDEGTVVYIQDEEPKYEVEFAKGNVICLNGHHIALVRPDIPDKTLLVIEDYESGGLNSYIIVYSSHILVDTKLVARIDMDDIEEWLRLARPHLFKESKIDPLIEGIGNLDLIDSFTV